MELMEVLKSPQDKVGFKNTEVGQIPESWDVKTIHDISIPVRGGSPRPAGSSLYFNGNYIPWLTVASLTNIPDSKIFVDKTKTCLTEAGSKLSRTLDKGTLIIANSGATLGVAKLLAIKCCANDGVAALLEIDKNCNPKYLVYYINSITKRLREDIATGNGQPNLNTELIGNIKFPIPPTLEEQKAIATALSDTDDLIARLEKLIAKKKAIKQGAMQQLLTPPHKGGKRLPEFSGEWEEKKLTEVVDYIHGKAHEQYIDPFGNYTVVNSKFISTDGIIRKHSSENFCPAKKGDILTVLSDLPNGKALAKTFLVDENDTYAVNQRICIYRTRGANPTFLKHVLNRHKYFLKFDDGVTRLTF